MPSPSKSTGHGGAELGRRVRDLRRNRGLTQEDAAHQAGITRNHFQLLEAGLTAQGDEANPTLKTIVAVARALDVDPSELVSIRRSARLDRLRSQN